MKFLFIFFIFFSYFLLTACTSGKSDVGESFFEEEEDVEEFSQIEEEVQAEEEGDLQISKEEEYDDEELEFMTDSDESVAYTQDTQYDQNEEIDFGDDEIFENPDILESDISSSNDDNMMSVDSEPPQQKKGWVSLKKIPQTTWMHDGKWINSVYIVRPNESLMDINQKMYESEDRQEELKSVNPLLKRRDPKVGDKIYYNSPIRPQDRNQFLVYYEDQKQIPESYDIQKGENIREIASQLLGHKDSWKEIWATNLQVESKWTVNKNVTIQYWPNNQQPYFEPEMVATAPETLEEEAEIPSTEEFSEMEALDDSPQPPVDPHDGIEGEIIEAGDLLIPDMDNVPPDAGPPPFENPPQEINNTDTSQTSLQNWRIKGGIIGLILIVIAFWFSRLIKSRKKKSDFDFSQTNINIDEIEE